MNHIRSVASGIFSYACSKGYISVNPWQTVVLTGRPQDTDDGVAYTEQEVELLIDALARVQGREEYSAELAGMVITLCFYAGLRPSEAAGLRWESVTDTRLTIERVFVAGEVKESTKTKKDRKIDMLQRLSECRPRFSTPRTPSVGL